MIPANKNEKTLQDSITSEEKIRLIINYIVNRLSTLRKIYINPYYKLKIRSLQDYTDMQFELASILDNYWHIKYNIESINKLSKLAIGSFSKYIKLSLETPESILNQIAIVNSEAREELDNASKIVLILEEMDRAELEKFQAKRKILGDNKDFEIASNEKVATVRIVTKLIELSLSECTFNVDNETWKSFYNINYKNRPKCEVSIIRKDGLIIPNDKIQQILYKNVDKNNKLITELDGLMLKYTNKILYIIENSKETKNLSIDMIYNELMKNSISDKDLLNYLAADEIEQLKELEKSKDEAATAIRKSLNAIINRCKEVIEKGNTIC